LQSRTDQFGVEMRERVTWDIRQGVIGADSFEPKHALIATWKNMSFAGGIDMSLYRTNTFQLVLVTDEVFTYAIFNYLNLQWTSHTEAGGDTTQGENGVPAFVSDCEIFSSFFAIINNYHYIINFCVRQILILSNIFVYIFLFLIFFFVKKYLNLFVEFIFHLS